MTTIDHAFAIPAAAPSVADEATTAALAEQRFLDSVRRRVAWQADRAAELRAAAAAPRPVVDVLDIHALDRLVASWPNAPRALEWTAFLGELHELADEAGRLPDVLERLVRVVLAEIL